MLFRSDREVCDSRIQGFAQVFQSEYTADCRRVELPIAVILREILQESDRDDTQRIQKFIAITNRKTDRYWIEI